MAARTLPAVLDCGDPDGHIIYTCGDCGHTRCAIHRDQPHHCPTCPEFGVRDGLPLHETKETPK